MASCSSRQALSSAARDDGTFRADDELRALYADEGVDFGWGQERDDPFDEPFRWNRQDPLDEHGVLRVTQRGVGEQRPDRCQANVSGPDAVLPLVLQVVEERRDRGGVQVVPVEIGW